jgi:hypothetical protein
VPTLGESTTPVPTPAFKGDVIGFARNSQVRLIRGDPGADDWFAEAFGESAWQSVLCPIGLGYNLADFNVSRGFGGTLPTRIPEFYVRARLVLTPIQYSALNGIIVRIAADDSADLLVRGVVFASEAAQGKVNVAKYWNHEYHLPKSMLALGSNVIGAHVINKQTPDTTFFDMEILLSFIEGGSFTYTSVPPMSVAEAFANTSAARNGALAAGELAGAVVGSVIGFVVLLAIAAAVYLRRRKRKGAANPVNQHELPNYAQIQLGPSHSQQYDHCAVDTLPEIRLPPPRNDKYVDLALVPNS